MNYSRQLVRIGIVVLLASGVWAQTPRRRPPGRQAGAKVAVPQPTPEAASAPLTPREPKAPIPLAIVNGQTLTTADIDPRVREEVEGLEDRIAETRRQMLELQINTALLDLEAKKRRLTTQQVYNLEVAKRLTDPPPAEINKFLEDNRDQLDSADDATLRQEVTSLLRANQEAKISGEFVRRLRAANPVVMGVDINTPNLNQAAVLATVAGSPITAGVVIERLKPAIYRLQLETYEIQKEALERTINDLLLIAEAGRRSVGPEVIVRTEVSEKIHAPTEAEVEKFYSENKTRINGDLNSVRNQIADYLREQERQLLERAMSERLRKGANVRLLVSEPQAPRQLISTDDDPSRGEATAPVTVVEFTDFQCPACAAMHLVLDEVIKAYGNKVRFVVRDFPLTVHANARKAAEAANAAHAQGKFFEYAALLFKRQNALDVPSLKKYASELGLDRARFDAALDKETYAAEVRHDVQDGEIYGINSTPTIFINGSMLRILSADALRAAIDQALAAAATPKTTSN
ncbi:MAG: DsbA family protein [Pyrinomonadaceae bacterium]